MKPTIVFDSILQPSAFSKVNSATNSNNIAANVLDDTPSTIHSNNEGLISTSVNKIMTPNPVSLSALC